MSQVHNSKVNWNATEDNPLHSFRLPLTSSSLVHYVCILQHSHISCRYPSEHFFGVYHAQSAYLVRLNSETSSWTLQYSISYEAVLAWCMCALRVCMQSGTRRVRPILAFFFFLTFFCNNQLVGFYFPNQGLNPSPWQSMSPNHWSAREFPTLVIFLKSRPGKLDCHRVNYQ